MPIPLHLAIAAVAKSDDPSPEVWDIASRRASSALFFRGVKAANTITDVEIEDHVVTAPDGHRLTCKWYRKRGVNPTGAAVLHVHGGGMIHSSAEDHIPLVVPYVSKTAVPFFSVDYRLAPEARAPTQVTDCYAALQYLLTHQSEFGFDPKRLAVMGDSAGGGIAASLVHYALKERGSQVFSRQILIYPMLDDRNTVPDPELGSGGLLWTYDDNKTGWGALLRPERMGGEDVTVCEAAGRMTDDQARGLPPTYMDLGDLDIFRDEDLLYASKLVKAGVSVELHLLPGMTHGYDLLAPQEEMVKEVCRARMRVLAGL